MNQKETERERGRQEQMTRRKSQTEFAICEIQNKIDALIDCLYMFKLGYTYMVHRQMNQPISGKFFYDLHLLEHYH